MKLSILICTLLSRKDVFDKLHKHLLKQIIDNRLETEVEIVVFEDNFEFPVGVKRNQLMKNASGEFICFVDDDDWVPDDYVITIYNTIRDNPHIDCIGFKGLLVSNDLGNREFIHSLKYDNYFEDKDYYYRPPNHISPIRRSLIKDIKFPIKNFGEDFDWTMRICKGKILKDEVFLDKIMYFYNFEFSKSATAGKK